MSHYICRLVDPAGTVLSVVPVICSSEADAIVIAQHHFKSHGEQGGFELWKGKTRILAHGKIDDDAPPPHIGPMTSAGS